MAIAITTKPDLTLRSKRTGQVFQILSTSDADFPIASLGDLILAAEVFQPALQTVYWEILKDAAIECLAAYGAFKNVGEFARKLNSEFV